MKRIPFLLLFLVLSISTFAQKTVQGRVLDKKTEGSIEGATIRLLNASDSSLVQGCFTDDKGAYMLSRVKNGNYIIEVRYLGYQNTFTGFSMQDKALILKTVFISPNDRQLKEVQVNGMTAQLQVKGDTIEYNPAAFKLQENAMVEDLLKKLPGVTVDNDGKITVNGQEIKKIRVDGKKFFSEDITMTTKNLPANIVDKVQVIDQKSDMAKLTGFEDENTERIINLTIKSDKRKGVFGYLGAGAGADQDNNFRYDANGMINFWKDKSQPSLIVGANNVNNQRSGGGRGGFNSSSSGNVNLQNIGFNNNLELSGGSLAGGNVRLNHTTNDRITDTERINYLNDSTQQTTFSKSTSSNNNKQANLNFELEWKIDTLSTLIIQPNIAYSDSYSESAGSSTNFRNQDSISFGNSNSSSNNKNISGGLRLIYSKKSKSKPGRTLSVNFGTSVNNTDGNGYNYTQRYTYADQKDSIIDQRTQNKSNSLRADMRLSYVEPLWNINNLIEVAGSLSGNQSTSERNQFNKDANDEYTSLDKRFSNDFTNSFYNESLELNFRHQDKTINYMLGMKLEPSQNYSTNEYKDGSTLKRSNEVLNYSPTADFRYSLARRTFFRLNYRGRTSQPSIDQMQPVKSNNPMSENTGNLSLKPSFNNNLQFSYSNFNQTRFSSLNLSLNGGYTLDDMVDNTIYNQVGKTFNQTVNSPKTPYNVGGSIMFNTPVFENRLQFFTNTEASYNQRYSYSSYLDVVNPYDTDGYLPLGNLNTTKTKSINQSLNLTYTTSVLEIGTRQNIDYKVITYTLNRNKNENRRTWTSSGNVNLFLPWNFTVSNDLNYVTRSGYSTFTKNELIWNASIDKSVLKKMGTISLKLNDILRQKSNISDNINGNNQTISRTNTLTSYFLLSFTYRISQFGGGRGGFGGFGGGNRGGGGGFGGGRMGGGGPGGF